MWTAAAPSSAAPRHSLAMCSGVMGRCGVCSGLVRLPVTAQVMKVLAFIMGLLEGAPAVDHEDLAGGEAKGGGARLDGGGHVVGGADALEGRGGGGLRVEVGAAS